MERIGKISLQGKTTEEAVKIMEKWINDTADKANYALTHLDEKNFSEGKKPMTQAEVQQSLDAMWENVTKVISANKGE
jgi:predicted RNA-binding protein Jag